MRTVVELQGPIPNAPLALAPEAVICTWEDAWINGVKTPPKSSDQAIADQLNAGRDADGNPYPQVTAQEIHDFRKGLL